MRHSLAISRQIYTFVGIVLIKVKRSKEQRQKMWQFWEASIKKTKIPHIGSPYRGIFFLLRIP